MQSRNNSNFYFGLGYDFNKNNVLSLDSSGSSMPIPSTGDFLLLDGSNFLLLDGTDFLLL